MCLYILARVDYLTAAEAALLWNARKIKRLLVSLYVCPKKVRIHYLKTTCAYSCNTVD